MKSKTHVPLYGSNRGRGLTGIRVRNGTAPLPWKPKDIEENYNFPDGDGEGQSIAIAQFNGGYFADDLSTYCQKLKKSTPDVQLISVDAPAYTREDILAIQNPDLRKAKLEWSFEVMMDVEIIAGLCPKASISVYFSTFDKDGWVHLLEKVIAVDPPPVALSISWGLAEGRNPWTRGAMDQINNELKKVSEQGITACVASVDDGWKSGVVDDDFAHVMFPSCSPFVMAVGGTMLKSGDEVAWNEDQITDVDGQKYGGGASGGGVSQYFRRPAWQRVHIASLNPGSFDGRVVPDVAALAGEPYYYLRFLNMPWSAGETSASAPVWAALIARINAKLPQKKQRRFIAPLLYEKLTNGKTVGEVSFHDITIGNNAICHHPNNGYKAGPGFDAVTGWGVPKGVDLLNCLAQI